VPDFHDLVFHLDFEGHQAEAGRRVVTQEEAEQAWLAGPMVVPNRRRKRAPYLMVGRTSSGRDVTVVLLATEDPGTWLAYTAWDTKPTDR
jgi:hypothetical protein